jgi:hypothetical protein
MSRFEPEDGIRPWACHLLSSLTMSHQHTLLLLSALLLPGAVLAQGSAASPPAEFVFRFNPPDGTRVITTYTLQRTRTIDGQPPVRDEVEAKSEGIFKRAGTGFEFAQRTLSSAMRRNGSLVDDPVISLLAQVPFTSIISAEGELTDARGFEKVEALVTSRLTAQVAAALAPVLSQAALAGRAKAEWNARYADFAGAKLKIGDVIDAQEPQPLPTGGTLIYTVRTTFPRWEPCPAGYCVRIEQRYESDAKAIAELATSLSRNLVAAASAPASASVSAESSGARVSGSLSRVIDPNTMLIYSEQVERTLTMHMQIPGKGLKPVTQHEVRAYRHTYDRP